MNQIKTGQFIAACRKEQGLTQAQLAEKIGVSDRAVSKWENGKALPDASNMLDVCEVLGISVNELLTGERVEQDDYKAKAEAQLLQLKELEENKNCQLIRLKNVIFWTCYAANFVLLFISCYIENDRPLKIFLAVFSCVFITLMSFIRLITERMGKIPYECEKCGHQHIPTTLNLVFNPTILSPTANTYYMKCPHCGERTLHIRILSKD